MKTISGPRIVIAWMVIIVLIFFAALGVFTLVLTVYERFRQPDRVVSQKIKSAMKYHGVHYVECVGDKCGFYRNGRWVKL